MIFLWRIWRKPAALFLVLFYSSCSDPAKRHPGKKIFRYNEASDITSLDPAFAKDLPNTWACTQLYSGLVQVDSNLRVKPCIAKRWEITDKGTCYTFHLRNDVYFHANTTFEVHSPKSEYRNTRRVIASDFVYSFSRLIDPSVGSPGAWTMSHVIKGSEGNLFGIEAVDDSTLNISLAKPFAPLLTILSLAYCSVVPHEVVEYFGKDFKDHPCGTGPFLFRLWKKDEKLVFLKNENFFERDERGTRLPYLDAVEVSFFHDRQRAFVEFLKGNLDLIGSIDGSFSDQILTRTGMLQPNYQGRFQLAKIPYQNTEHLNIELDTTLPIMKNSPLLDRRIRQALSYGFDRKKMLKTLRNNIGIAGADGFVPPGLPSFDTTMVTGYFYYPSKVRSLLKEAGHEDGKGLPEINLSTNIENLDLCEFIKSQWEEFGFKVHIVVHSHEDHLNMIRQQKFSLFRISWIADYADAENYLSLFYSKNFSPGGSNYTHFASKEYDEIYEKALAEVNDSARYKLYQYMDQVLMENVPVIIMYYDQVVRLMQNNISGLDNNAMNILVLKRVRKS